jgi:hypothetical protein
VLVNFIPTFYISKVASLALAGKATLANTATSLAILVACVIVVFAAVVWMLRRERK